MTGTYQGDLHTITTADGNVLHFPDQSFKLRAYGGYGAPPVNYITRRGYKQHGETELDYNVQPRSLSIQLWRDSACNRITYWQNRAALHEFLRPNRGGPAKFTLIMPDGTQRAIYVRVRSGLDFAPTPDDNAWYINEPIEFVAFDPFWFNPVLTAYTTTLTSDSELVFPIDFPIWFGAAGGIYQQEFTYNGTWKTYPTLVLTGPYTNATIENLSIDAAIYMAVPIAVGETRTITLQEGNISIVDQNGVSAFGELGPLTNLVDFAVYPDPEVPSGLQTIRTTFTNPTAGVTGFTMSFNERYFAL